MLKFAHQVGNNMELVEEIEILDFNKGLMSEELECRPHPEYPLKRYRTAEIFVTLFRATNLKSILLGYRSAAYWDQSPMIENDLAAMLYPTLRYWRRLMKQQGRDWEEVVIIDQVWNKFRTNYGFATLPACYDDAEFKCFVEECDLEKMVKEIGVLMSKEEDQNMDDVLYECQACACKFGSVVTMSRRKS